MKFKSALILLLVITAVACKTPKTYFTPEIRRKLEAKSIDLTKLQFYVDRDVELRRELESGDVKVQSGKVKFENGKYIHIIFLKKYTPGICTTVKNNALDISFEEGDGKFLTFMYPGNGNDLSPYQISAVSWVSFTGEVVYEGQIFKIQPSGSEAKLMIKKKAVDKLDVEKRKMKGRKVE